MAADKYEIVERDGKFIKTLDAVALVVKGYQQLAPTTGRKSE